jgi:cell division septation protein DedD
MAKRSAGERVLESKHVIGLFLLMLVFSGVFFTLGYVMGRNQYDGQVRAATTGMTTAEAAPARNASKKGGAELAPAEVDSDPATASSSGWDYYTSAKPANAEPRLEAPKPAVPAPTPAAPAAKSKTNSNSNPAPAPAPVAPTKNSRGTSLIPSDALLLQVAALKRQDDALAIASSLQKKHYAAYVQPPSKDKYYRVQVGPFKDQKSAEAAKKGLESEGFKAFYAKH